MFSQRMRSAQKVMNDLTEAETCAARSFVGTKMRAEVYLEALEFLAVVLCWRSDCKIGRRYARVLPEPVFARAMELGVSEISHQDF
jgi:hypothetical protein